MIKRHLAAFLKDDPELRKIVDGRIFPGRARQGNRLPYVILQTTSGAAYNDLPGEPDYTSGLIEVAVYSETDRQSTEISERIRQLLSGYRGPMGDNYCHGSQLMTPAQGYTQRPTDGTDNWTFISSADYTITYNQSLTENCGEMSWLAY